uniref:Uncharacterized protein n=1 Tax=Chrysemys picta bellii TaxID=8478 RepID=A0A8C3FNX4_CHRPI
GPGLLGSITCYARLEVDVLHRQLLLAQQSRRLGGNPSVVTFAAGDALAGRAAAHTELQVLLFAAGPPGARRWWCRCRQPGSPRAARAHVPGWSGCSPPALATVHRAILKGSRQVVYFGLVDLLVDAFLHVLKYDRELQGKKKTARLDPHPGLVPVNCGGERGKRKGL